MATNEFDDDRIRSTTSLAAGTTVSHYRIVSKIGAGGMGEVYLAEDTDLHRHVALKILPQSMCKDEDCRAQFKREAQTVARLNHPNIVQIYEVQEYEGRLYFVMEYVEGPTLAEACQASGDAVKFATEVGVQICDALEAAHAIGIIHRDVKPANILLGEDGRARLVDFGLAVFQGRDQLSSKGSTPGTAGYMSPEQIRGTDVDARSDIFGLGVVLYELLAGRRPFTGDYEAAVQYAIINDAVPPLKDSGSDVPDELSQIIQRALNRDPDKRIQSAAEFRSLLKVSSEAGGKQASGLHLPRSLVPWTVAIALLAVIAAWWLFKPSSPVNEPIRIAVLPVNLIGPKEDSDLAAGITEVLTTDLAGLEAIQVVSARSASQLASSGLDHSAMGDGLRLTHWVEGTLQSSEGSTGTGLTISLRLLDLHDDRYIWSKEYRTDEAGLLTVRSQMSMNIAHALNAVVTPAEKDRLDEIPTSSPEAWELFVRGNGYFHRTWTVDDISMAMRLFSRAVAIDSNFAMAWAMLSRGHSSMYWEYYDRSDERCTQALQAAEKALSLQPDLAEGHEALGYVYYHCYRRFDAALDEFKSGLTFQPNNSELYNAVAAVQRRQGQLGKAVDNFKTALHLDPQSDLKSFDIALTYGMMRMYDSALVYTELALRLEPSDVLPYLYRAWLPIIASGDTKSSARALADAESRSQVLQSPFYWWLLRLTNQDYERQLQIIRPGIDTAAFLIHTARLNRLAHKEAEAEHRADQAYGILSRKLTERPDDPLYLSQMSLVDAYRGDCAKSVESGTRALSAEPASLEAFDAPFLIINFAEALVVCGQYDDAVAQLQLVLSIPGFASASYLKLDPLWEPLRDLPAFRELVSGQ